MDDGEGGGGQGEAGAGEQQGEECGADDAAADDGQQVLDAGEAPVLLGQAEQQPGEQQGDGAAGDEPKRVEQAARGVGDPAGEGGREGGESAVERDVDEDAVALAAARGLTSECRAGEALRRHRGTSIARFPPFRTLGRSFDRCRPVEAPGVLPGIGRAFGAGGAGHDPGGGDGPAGGAQGASAAGAQGGRGWCGGRLHGGDFGAVSVRRVRAAGGGVFPRGNPGFGRDRGGGVAGRHAGPGRSG